MAIQAIRLDEGVEVPGGRSVPIARGIPIPEQLRDAFPYHSVKMRLQHPTAASRDEMNPAYARLYLVSNNDAPERSLPAYMETVKLDTTTQPTAEETRAAVRRIVAPVLDDYLQRRD